MRRIHRVGLVIALALLTLMAAIGVWAWQTASGTFTVNVRRGTKVGACEVFGSSVAGKTTLGGGMWIADCDDGSGYRNPATGMKWKPLNSTTGQATLSFPDGGYIIVEGGWNRSGLTNPKVRYYRLDDNAVEAPTN